MCNCRKLTIVSYLADRNLKRRQQTTRNPQFLYIYIRSSVTTCCLELWTRQDKRLSRLEKSKFVNILNVLTTSSLSTLQSNISKIWLLCIMLFKNTLLLLGLFFTNVFTAPTSSHEGREHQERAVISILKNARGNRATYIGKFSLLS